MITLTSLSKIYRTNEIETVALENVNLKVDRGEFLSIMGPSGCGKSTLLNMMELDAPTAASAPTPIDSIEYYGVAGCAYSWNNRNKRHAHGRDEG